MNTAALRSRARRQKLLTAEIAERAEKNQLGLRVLGDLGGEKLLDSVRTKGMRSSR